MKVFISFFNWLDLYILFYKVKIYKKCFCYLNYKLVKYNQKHIYYIDKYSINYRFIDLLSHYGTINIL